jgi:hypothetical protein
VANRLDGIPYYPYNGGNIVRTVRFTPTGPSLNSEGRLYATYSADQQRWFWDDWYFYNETGNNATEAQFPQRIPFSGVFYLFAWLAHRDYNTGVWQTSVPVAALVTQGYGDRNEVNTYAGICQL